MARTVAPAKNTSGAGFTFEDKVVAFYLSCLLAGEPPFAPGLGHIGEVSRQTSVDGWLLDDLLLTLRIGEETIRCALSIKSNWQFSSTGKPPAEFVRQAWTQFLQEPGSPFVRGQDKLGLVTIPQSRECRKTINDLLSKAAITRPDTLEQRITVKGFATPEEVRLFVDFACPANLAAGKRPEDIETGDLAASLLFPEFDFESETSSSEQSAVRNCRACLVDNSLEEANRLWTALLKTAIKYKNAGTLDYPGLVSELRSHFRLKNHPNHQDDWNRLRERTQLALASVRDTIGGCIRLEREDIREQLLAAFQSHSVVVLLGPSGTGKTVIAKMWAEEHRPTSEILWWDGRDFNGRTFDAVEADLRLTHSLSSLMAAVSTAKAFAILDGIDRVFSQDAFATIPRILGGLNSGSLSDPWQLLITCQPEEWERVQARLRDANVQTLKWDVIQLQGPAAREMTPVWEAFPQLRRLSLQPEFRQLHLRPKLLDLIASRSNSGDFAGTQRILGEAHLIDWYWAEDIEIGPTGPMRCALIQDIAQQQADHLKQNVPISSCTLQRETLQELARDRILRVTKGTVDFDHDLLGDWARQRILLLHIDSLREFIEPRLASPLWHRAIRLLSLHLLERDPDTTTWKRVFAGLTADDGHQTVAQDLFLEAAVYGGDTPGILARLWPDLEANGGLLLRRFLRRFLQAVTIPNQQILNVIQTGSSFTRVEAAAVYRIPYWPLWPPVILLLEQHAEHLFELAPLEAAEVAHAWLQATSADFPLRQSMADVALTLAERWLALEHQRSYVPDKKPKEAAYLAALAAYHECPDRVTAFALEACGRKQPTGTSEDELRALEEIRLPSIFGGQLVPRPEPWQDGPKWPVDDEFQEVCLNQTGLHPLISENPELAKEIALAVLIERRRPPDPFGGMHFVEARNCGLDDPFRWFPPFYYRGPFAVFLRDQPSLGIDLILALVNFVTSRWEERRGDTEGVFVSLGEPASLTIELDGGAKTYVGDEQVLFWHRDGGNVPHAAASALMALEKWFYDQLDGDENIEPAIRRMLDKAQSLAFIGVLLAVGKKNKDLLAGVLRPLMTVPELYLWDSQHTSRDELLMIGWVSPFSSEELFNLAREWHSLPHRKEALERIGVEFCLLAKDLRPFFEATRQKWEARVSRHEDGGLQHYIEKLAAMFNPENWTASNTGAGTVMQFHPPDPIRSRSEAALPELLASQRLILFPFQCKQLLDAGAPLPDDQLEGFWEQIQRLSAIEGDTATSPAACPEDGVIGGIAVLATLHWEWLLTRSERYRWCLDRIVLALTQPPTTHRFEDEHTGFDMGWISFAAQALARFWAETPNNVQIRALIVRLVFHYQYQTTKSLFSAASKYRSKLGPHFLQLQALLEQWAVVRWQFERERRWLDYSQCEAQEVQPFRWFLAGCLARLNLRVGLKRLLPKRELLLLQGNLAADRLAGNFVSGKLAGKFVDWSVLAERKYFRGHALDGVRRRGEWEMDLSLIRAAYEWLPALRDAEDDGEFERWLSFWRRVLRFSQGVIAKLTLGEDEVATIHRVSDVRMPGDDERWALHRLGGLMIDLPPESAREFWHPFLSLDIDEHYWAESFLWGWHHAYRADSVESFAEVWKQMIHFALSDPTWNQPRWRREDLWCRLLAIDELSRSLWGEEHLELHLAMRDTYACWTDRFLPDRKCAQSFIRTLREPGAQAILADALQWLDASRLDLTDDRGFSDIKPSLAKLLNFCWAQRQDLVEGDLPASGAFRNLLRKLADYQNPLALEILRQL